VRVPIDIKLLPTEAKLELLEAIRDPEAARQRRQQEHIARWGVPRW
jgi:hypothetical protein